MTTRPSAPSAQPTKAMRFPARTNRAVERRFAPERGVILPIALIMLVILSVAGILAAKKSAITEQVSNNVRTSNVAQQAAEVGIRFCEAVVIDKIDGKSTLYKAWGDLFVADADLLSTTTDAGAGAKWRSIANWKKDAGNLISVPVAFYAPNDSLSEVNTDARLSHAPTCIVQRLAPVASNIFLITARGLSNNAEVDDTTGKLKGGSEIWLQSILSPGNPEPPKP